MNRNIIIIIVIIIISSAALAILWRQNQALSQELKLCMTRKAPSCPTCYPDACAPYPFMDIKLAAQLVQNYREHHWKAVNREVFPFSNSCLNMSTITDPEGLTIDSRSAWYNLQDLKSFIKTIETLSNNGNCTSCPDLGIRIYFGEYPADIPGVLAYGFSSADAQDLIGKHTLLMVPTYHDINSNLEVDFDAASFTCPGSSIFDTLHIASGSFPAMIPARNHGGLRPPPYTAPAYWQNSGATFMMFSDLTDQTGQSNPFTFSNWPPVH